MSLFLAVEVEVFLLEYLQPLLLGAVTTIDVGEEGNLGELPQFKLYISFIHFYYSRGFIWINLF